MPIDEGKHCKNCGQWINRDHTTYWVHDSGTVKCDPHDINSKQAQP